MTIYFDRFAQEYVTKIDLFAAPERYYQLSYFYTNIENDIDECIEVWKLNNLDNAYIRYKKELLSNPDLINKLRNKVFIEHNVVPLRMTEWIVPEDMYNEILKEVE